jgi:hypothetical protein
MSAVFGYPFLPFLRALVDPALIAPSPVTRHAVEQLLITRWSSGGLIDDDYIKPRQFGLVLPERFSNNALDSVSACR